MFSKLMLHFIQCVFEQQTKYQKCFVLQRCTLASSIVKMNFLMELISRKYLSSSGNWAFTLWKNKKHTLTEKIFRQINHSAISLVRTFCKKKIERADFRKFHTVALH